MPRRVSLGRDAVMKLRQLFVCRDRFAYCDVCLAGRLDVDLAEAKAAAQIVNRELGLSRERANCDKCGRMARLTSMTKRRK